MRELSRNPETGFLESANVNPYTEHRRAFDSAKKVALLSMVQQHIAEHQTFPSLYAICKIVGVSMKTFEEHKNIDKAFKAAWDEIIASLKSVYTNKLAVKADSKNGIVANLAILKYLETGSFVDRVQLNHSTDNASDKRINDALIVDIDPDIQEYPTINGTRSDDTKAIDTQRSESASNETNNVEHNQ